MFQSVSFAIRFVLRASWVMRAPALVAWVHLVRVRHGRVQRHGRVGARGPLGASAGGAPERRRDDERLQARAERRQREGNEWRAHKKAACTASWRQRAPERLEGRDWAAEEKWVEWIIDQRGSPRS